MSTNNLFLFFIGHEKDPRYQKIEGCECHELCSNHLTSHEDQIRILVKESLENEYHEDVTFTDSHIGKSFFIHIQNHKINEFELSTKIFDIIKKGYEDKKLPGDVMVYVLKVNHYIPIIPKSLRIVDSILS